MSKAEPVGPHRCAADEIKGVAMAWSKLSRHERGYGAAWDRLRKVVINRDQHLCQACLKLDRVTVGNQVDHITPKAKGGTDDLSNLQLLCAPCHDAKTTHENGGKPKQAIGADGWPIT